MTDFVADTHALIWYLEDSPRLSVAAKSAFNACDKGPLPKEVEVTNTRQPERSLFFLAQISKFETIGYFPVFMTAPDWKF